MKLTYKYLVLYNRNNIFNWSKIMSKLKNKNIIKENPK